MIVGCFTPYVKMFLPFFYVPVLDEKGKPKLNKDGTAIEKMVTCSDLLKDPDRIVKDEPFRFIVPRSVGGFFLNYNRPVHVPDKNLVMFLTGDDIGQQIDPTYQISNETDCYGVAQIALRPDVQGALVTSIAGVEGDPEAILKEERKAAKTAHDHAVKVSEHRCIRAARQMVRNLKNQRQKDKEANRGSYVPSPSEYLAAYFLAEQETKEAEEMARVVDQFSSMMDKIEAKSAALVR